MSQVLTYTHSLLIPLTRACGAECNYCTFKDNEEKILSFDEIEALISRHYNSGICEVLLTGGQNLERIPAFSSLWLSQGYAGFIEYVRDVCQFCMENHLIPTLELGPLTYAQLQIIAPYIAGITINLENVNPESLAPYQTNKSLDDKIESIGDAGLLGIPVTTGLLMGLGESLDDHMATLDAVEELHQRHHHIQSVVFNYLHAENKTPSRIEIDAVKVLVSYSKKLMPDVLVSIPFNSPLPWFEENIFPDDMGRVFEGSDGIQWNSVFPKRTEIEKSLAKKNISMRPRTPASNLTNWRAPAQVASVLNEWRTKKEYHEV